MTYDPIDFLERAVQTPSHDGVDEMRSLLVSELEAAGVEVSVDQAGNTIASRGTGDTHIVLNTHIDTVTPHVPFRRDDGIIRGRGSCDAKGPLAAMIGGFLHNECDGKVTLAITPDEETASIGADSLSVEGDYVIVGEPTGLDVCNAARGRFEGTITIEGENAHAAEPDAGRNAIRAAGDIIGLLEGFDEKHGPGEHESLGRPLLTPTVIEGGGARNQIPDSCSIVFDRRSVPPETACGFRESLESFLVSCVPESIQVDVGLTPRDTPFLEAFETDPESVLVQAMATASSGEVRPFGAATEASYFAADGTPTVVFGPGVLADANGPVAHADREYIKCAEVVQASDILTTVINKLGTGEAIP